MRIDRIISELVGRGEPCFSFEFFPPKSADGEQSLFQTLMDLCELSPGFVSVTWGAGGSTREKTVAIIKRIRTEFELEAMAHFTCVDATVDDLNASLREIAAAGIENVLALRGDPPAGSEQFVPTNGGLSSSTELMELLKARFNFCAVGACYPEVHPEAPDLETDISRLCAKVAAGAKVLITQLFFDNDRYFHFVKAARAAGIDVPIIPGIMPITNFEQVKRFTSMCGAQIPGELSERLERIADNPTAVQGLGVAYATLQCAELLAAGVPGIHFYTLNKSFATRAILTSLKLHRPWVSAR